MSDDVGYIYGRALPRFGLWNKFSLQKIAKERIFVKPNPMITQHTEPNRPWVTSSIQKPGTVSLFYLEFKNPLY